jgi:hypothetical protein
VTDGHESRRHWDDTGLLMVVSAVVLAPLAWFLDLQASYALVKWACRHERRDLLLMLPIASLSLSALAGWMSWSSWTKLRGAGPLARSVEDRSYFLSIVGLGLAALFALLILASLVPRAVLNPCQ